MEAMKMKMFLAVATVAVMVSSVAAQEAPAPSPASDAALFVPSAIASLAALAFGFMM